jgi:hypothetical protein
MIDLVHNMAWQEYVVVKYKMRATIQVYIIFISGSETSTFNLNWTLSIK